LQQLSEELHWRRREVRALPGENGAGKSTLMHILAGVLAPDEGAIRMAGREVHFHDARAAQEARVAVVFQERSLAGPLSVAENVFVGRQPVRRWGIVERAKLHEQTRVILDDLGIAIDPGTALEHLSRAQQQMVEIAKALSLDACLLVLDEPTSTLTETETAILFRVIERLKQRSVGIVYISHRMGEVFQICDRMTVLRDGVRQGTFLRDQVTQDELISRMVGRTSGFERPARTMSATTGVPALEVRGLCDGQLLQNVSFVAQTGAITAFAGLAGSGRTELAMSIFGARRARSAAARRGTSGEVLVKGRPVAIRAPIDAIEAGVGYLPEDRKEAGLFLEMSVAANVAAASLHRFGRWWLNDRAMEQQTAAMASRMRLTADTRGRRVQELSGGNQQKVILARWLLVHPPILIVDEPTRGINVGAKQEVHQLLREFEIELAEGEPDFWVFLDISMFRRKKATLRVASLSGDSAGWQAIVQSDTIKGAADLYREKHRPQFHFSSRRGWNNDSNGLVFYKGEYHLYYQHNPYGWNWGNMHWGHAVSTDLVHWKELPIALYPQRFGDWCFSGSAVVDVDNTAGFKTGAEDVIVAAYTSTGRGECIAYSTDRGRTFTDYPGNPVVTHKGRDPKIIWYAPGGRWVTAVYDEQGKSRGISFYTSRNLKDWQFRSRIDGFYECPEIFELPVDGNQNNKRWVVHAADGNYMIGHFDGETFRPESAKQQWSYGNCFYASQTFNNLPREDGRRIQIAWGRIATPGMPFNQCMLFPCELTLRTTEDGVRMFAQPVREIEKLHQQTYRWTDEAVRATHASPLPDGNMLSDVAGELLHIRGRFEIGHAHGLDLVIRGVPVVYDAEKRELSCTGKKAPLEPIGGTIQLEILVDRTSIEIFGNRGRVYMPIGVIPADNDRSLQLHARGGGTRIQSLEVYRLRSAWE
jgi:fructan beta-fructosidase